jgi:hypothetical protein
LQNAHTGIAAIKAAFNKAVAETDKATNMHPAAKQALNQAAAEKATRELDAVALRVDNALNGLRTQLDTELQPLLSPAEYMEALSTRQRITPLALAQLSAAGTDAVTFTKALDGMAASYATAYGAAGLDALAEVAPVVLATNGIPEAHSVVTELLDRKRQSLFDPVQANAHALKQELTKGEYRVTTLALGHTRAAIQRGDYRDDLLITGFDPNVAVSVPGELPPPGHAPIRQPGVMA